LRLGWGTRTVATKTLQNMTFKASLKKTKNSGTREERQRVGPVQSIPADEKGNVGAEKNTKTKKKKRKKRKAQKKSRLLQPMNIGSYGGPDEGELKPGKC